MPVDISLAIAEHNHAPRVVDKLHNISTGKEEPKYNGRYTSIVGEDVSVVIGMGRQNKTIGPVINSKIDPSLALEYCLGKIHHHFHKSWCKHLVEAGEFVLGQGGDTDFLLGNKTSFNYGSMDFHVTHKVHPATTIEYTNDSPKFKIWFNPLISAYVLAETGFSLGIRYVNTWKSLDIHDHDEVHSREKKAEKLIISHNTIGHRLLNALKLAETYLYVDDAAKQEKEVIKKAKDSFVNANLQLYDFQRNPNIAQGELADAYDDFLTERKNQWLAEARTQAERLIGDLGLANEDENGPRPTVNTRRINSKERWIFGDQFNIEIENSYKRLLKSAAGADGSPCTTLTQTPELFSVELQGQDSKPTTLFNLKSNSNIIKSPIISLHAKKDEASNQTQLNLTDSEFTINTKTKEASMTVKATDNDGVQVVYEKSDEKDKKSLLLDSEKAALYGGKKIDGNSTPGYIELKGKDSIVIQLLGNTITLNKDGIQISSDKEIKIKSEQKIVMGCKDNEIEIDAQKIKMKAAENELTTAVTGIKERAALVEHIIQATWKVQAAVNQSQFQAISRLQAALKQND